MQYPHKSMGNEVDLLPADKSKSFLQDDSINLGVGNQTGPKYQKQPVQYPKDEVDFLPTDKF